MQSMAKNKVLCEDMFFWDTKQFSVKPFLNVHFVGGSCFYSDLHDFVHVMERCLAFDSEH